MAHMGYHVLQRFTTETLESLPILKFEQTTHHTHHNRPTQHHSPPLHSLSLPPRTRTRSTHMYMHVYLCMCVYMHMYMCKLHVYVYVNCVSVSEVKV